MIFSDVLCGQLQCQDNRNAPVVDYGWTYAKIALDNGQQCRYGKICSLLPFDRAKG